MWNKSIRFPIEKNASTDADGFDTEEAIYMEGIPANFTDCTRNDQILARQSGYAVNVNVEVMSCNYDGQSYFIDEENGIAYDVKRKYRKDKSNIVILSCERRDRGGI